MLTRRILAPLVLVPLQAGVLSGHGAATAENIFSLYGGTSSTAASDLYLGRPGLGTGITVKDVKWDADPLQGTPYYGLRFAHFFDRVPNWGVALDYTHYKMHAQTGKLVSAKGSWNGPTIGAPLAMNQYVQHFETPQGANMLSVNGIYRWGGTEVAGGRLQPYLGAGLAYYRPHSEFEADNLAYDTGYQSSGLGYQLVGGAQYRLSQRWGAFVEAKFNNGMAKADMDNGRGETSLRAFQARIGVGYRF